MSWSVLGAAALLIVVGTAAGGLALARQSRDTSLVEMVRVFNERCAQNHDLGDLPQPKTAVEREFLRSSRQLDEKLQAFALRENRLTADASHELRTAVTAIRLGADLLLEERGQLKPHQSRNVRRIQAAATDIQALTEAMLILARASEQRLPSRRLEVNAIIGAELDRLRVTAGLRSEQFRLLEKSHFSIYGPPAALSVVVSALAREFTARHSQTFTVVVSDGYIVMRCADTADLALTTRDESSLAGRIARRMGWDLKMCESADGMLASLRFPVFELEEATSNFANVC